MFEKDGIVYESEDEYELNKNEIKKKKRKLSRSFVNFLISIGLIIGIPIAVWIFFGLSITDNYKYFTKKRIAEMEDKFNITVTDDFELVRYYRHSWQGTTLMLEIEGIEDYAEFMENNIDGTIIEKKENGMFYDYENNKEYESDMNDCIAYYVYEYTKKGYETDNFYDYRRRITFYREDDGTYSAVLTN